MGTILGKNLQSTGKNSSLQGEGDGRPRLLSKLQPRASKESRLEGSKPRESGGILPKGKVTNVPDPDCIWREDLGGPQ